ncbi:hypothetical protein Droror1_Dr00012391, partial [Drosera rotundifolia]
VGSLLWLEVELFVGCCRTATRRAGCSLRSLSSCADRTMKSEAEIVEGLVVSPLILYHFQSKKNKAHSYVTTMFHHDPGRFEVKTGHLWNEPITKGHNRQNYPNKAPVQPPPIALSIKGMPDPFQIRLPTKFAEGTLRPSIPRRGPMGRLFHRLF